MDELDIQKRAKKEQNRLKRLLTKAGISEEKRKMLEPVIVNTSWMAVKLDEARELIGTEPIMVEYDNGGGQKGVRENPALKAYESLWKSYCAGMQRLLDAINRVPENTSEEEPKEQENMLQLVRLRRQKEA